MNRKERVLGRFELDRLIRQLAHDFIELLRRDCQTPGLDHIDFVNALDSDLEIFWGTDNGYLYGFNHDGTGILDSTGVMFTATWAGGTPRIWGTIAIADIANDGNRVLAFGCLNDTLYVLIDGRLFTSYRSRSQPTHFAHAGTFNCMER